MDYLSLFIYTFRDVFSPSRMLGIKHGRWTDAEIHGLSSRDINASVLLWMFDCAAQQHLMISQNAKYDMVQFKRNFLKPCNQIPNNPNVKVAIRKVIWQHMRWLIRSLCTDVVCQSARMIHESHNSWQLEQFYASITWLLASLLAYS